RASCPSRWAPLQTTHRRLFSMKSSVVPNGGWMRRRKPRYLRGRQQCCSSEVTVATAAMVVVVVVSFLSLSTTVVADAASRGEARGCQPTITSRRLSTKETAFSVCGQQRLQRHRRRRHQKLPPHMSSPLGCFEERPPPSLSTATILTAAAPLRRLSPRPPLLVPEVSTRMRPTTAGRGVRGRATEVACRAVVEENQTSGQSGRPNSIADQQEGSASGLKGTPTLPRAHEGRGEEGERLPDGSLWEGIGEGLSGAFLHAQQGLEGLNLLDVGDAFWLNFGQMDVPELPTLSGLRIFGLSWPPPPAAREPKRQPASAAPATTAEGEAEGRGGGGESVTGTITGEIKTRGLPRRLSVWRRGRPKTDGGVGRTAAAAAAAAAADSASEEGRDRPTTKAGRWRKVGALAGLRKRLSLYGTRGDGGAASGQDDLEATSPVAADAPASAGGRWWFARNGAGGGEPQPKKGRRGSDAGGMREGGGSTRSMLRKGKDPSVGLSAPAKLEPVVTPAGKSSSKTLTQRQLGRPGQALVDRRNSSPKASPRPSPPPPPGGGKDKGKKQAGSSMSDKRKSTGPAGPPKSSKGQVAGRANVGEPPRGGEGGHTAVPEADKTSNKAERSVDNDGKTAAAATAPTHFIPKFAPPPNAWKILSSKSPVEEPKASDPSGDRSPGGSCAPPSSSSVPSGSGGAVGQDKWEGGSSEGSAIDIDDDDGEELDEFRDFGDLPLSVTSIPKPPDMGITINRSSGTPANAETRPAAAAAAKAAADSDNVLEEWVDGEPVEVHHGRTTSSWKPTRPDGLSGTSGEMKLVEMACLTGLSSRAGKSAGRIMLEELGFGHLLRGLRGDVRPSLQRRVLQAISTVIDSDPSLAPLFLGLDGLDHPDDDKTAKTKKKATAAGSSASAKKGVGGGGGSSSVRDRLQERRRRQQQQRRKRRVAGAGDGSPSSPGPAVGEDDLLERITAILGYHMVAGGVGSGGGAGSGTGFGVPGGVEAAVAPGGGDGPLGRAFRLVVGSLPLPRVRPFSSAVAAESLHFQQQRPPLEGAAAVGRGDGTREEGEWEGDYQVAREGRDWWKDEVALEEEGLEQQAATQAAAMFPDGGSSGGGGEGGSSGWVWWWGRGRRVSRERLVEEALELTFRLIMSGDAALDALKV
ncbi:unnamed protein product, partial [Ectocarpus sp. 4 AP-2014]